MLIESDENGDVYVEVGSQEVITIRSGLAAIEFTPITGYSSELFLMNPIVISGIRTVDLIAMCRAVEASDSDNLVFSVFNSSSRQVEILRDPFRNWIAWEDGSSVYPLPPESFAPGETIYTVPSTEFLDNSTLCRRGSYVLLGRRMDITCAEQYDDLDINLCTGDGLLPCSSVSSTALLKISKRAVRGFYIGKRSAAELRKRFRDRNKRFSIEREATRATRKIGEILSDIQAKVSTCSPHKQICFEVPFPKEHLVNTFVKGFRPRPPQGRSIYRAMIRRMEQRFHEALAPLPSTIVMCAD